MEMMKMFSSSTSHGWHLASFAYAGLICMWMLMHSKPTHESLNWWEKNREESFKNQMNEWINEDRNDSALVIWRWELFDIEFETSLSWTNEDFGCKCSSIDRVCRVALSSLFCFGSWNYFTECTWCPVTVSVINCWNIQQINGRDVNCYIAAFSRPFWPILVAIDSKSTKIFAFWYQAQLIQSLSNRIFHPIGKCKISESISTNFGSSGPKNEFFFCILTSSSIDSVSFKSNISPNLKMQNFHAHFNQFW